MLTKNTVNTISALTLALSATFASCHKEDMKTQQVQKQSQASLQEMISENNTNPDEILSADVKTLSGGYVYTESNEVSKNSIVIYKQAENGMLTWYKSVESGGTGNGKNLGSQDAVVLDANHHRLFAVNAGDNSVSSFWVGSDGSLTLAHTISSGGTLPVSVTVYGNWLYVVNSATANICGFSIGADGTLTKIDGSWQKLSDITAAPAQISFHPSGKVLYVTEKATSKIGTFKVNDAGVADKGKFINSVGQTPFGFHFARQQNFLLVSNAAAGGADAGSCTSYATDRFGNTNDVNGAVPDFEAAPCWVATTTHGRFAFVTNTADNSISSYFVAPNGALFHIFFTIVNTGAGTAPTDMIVSANNRYVYAINSTASTIGEYKRDFLGRLTKIGHVAVPPYANGLAAY